MPAALTGVGITTFAQDASRQPQQYSLGTALGAPRYPSNIYYNAANWPDQLNEYNTLYVAQGDPLGNTQFPSETGHCTDTSATTCLTTPATEADLLASESHIMLSHVLSNDPRVGYAHQSNLIGPATQNGQDYGYTILRPDQQHAEPVQQLVHTPAPLTQMTDVTEAQVLAEQGAWATAGPAGRSPPARPTAWSPSPTRLRRQRPGHGAARHHGQRRGVRPGLRRHLSDWVNLGTGATETLTENVAPAHHQRRVGHLDRRRRVQLHGHHHRRPGPGAHRDRCAARRRHLHRQRQRHGHHRRHRRQPAAAAATRSRSPRPTRSGPVTQTLHADQRRGPDHHQPGHGHVQHRGGGHLHGHHHRVPGGDAHRVRNAAQRADLHRQRQRHRHHLRHARPADRGHATR